MDDLTPMDRLKLLADCAWEDGHSSEAFAVPLFVELAKLQYVEDIHFSLLTTAQGFAQGVRCHLVARHGMFSGTGSWWGLALMRAVRAWLETLEKEA